MSIRDVEIARALNTVPQVFPEAVTAPAASKVTRTTGLPAAVLHAVRIDELYPPHGVMGHDARPLVVASEDPDGLTR